LYLSHKGAVKINVISSSL